MSFSQRYNIALVHNFAIFSNIAVEKVELIGIHVYTCTRIYFSKHNEIITAAMMAAPF